MGTSPFGATAALLAAMVLAPACNGMRPAGSGDETPESPALPVLEVVRPERGAFIPGEVEVSGHVLPGTGHATWVTVHDEDIAIHDDNTFETSLKPEPGMLILGTRVEDDLGERAVDGRAVQVGKTHAPGATLEEALALQIGPAMLDDDEPDLDDLAGVAEAVLADPSFASTIVGTTFEGTFDITVTGLSLGSVAIDVIPQSDVLWVDAYLSDVYLTFHTSIVGIGIDGFATASLAGMQTDLRLTTTGDGVTAEASEVVVWLEDFAWDADLVPTWAVDALTDTVRQMIEDQVEAKTKAMVADLVGETLSSFAVDTTFGDGDDMRVKMSMARAEVAPQGLMLWMDGSVSAERAGIDLPPNAGSLETTAAGPSLPLDTDLPLVVLADDDFVNQALFAFWHRGSLGGWELNSVEMAAMSGAALPPPLGPVEKVTLDVGLPPILSAPKGDMQLDISIGELTIGITREDGERVVVSINTRAGANLAFLDEGLSVSIDDRPGEMTIHAGMLEWPEALDPGDLASLFRLATPSLLGRSTSLMPAFPAPELPIGELLGVDAIEDLVWVLGDVEVAVEPSGWLVMKGAMVPQ